MKKGKTREIEREGGGGEKGKMGIKVEREKVISHNPATTARQAVTNIFPGSIVPRVVSAPNWSCQIPTM